MFSSWQNPKKKTFDLPLRCNILIKTWPRADDVRRIATELLKTVWFFFSYSNVFKTLRLSTINETFLRENRTKSIRPCVTLYVIPFNWRVRARAFFGAFPRTRLYRAIRTVVVCTCRDGNAFVIVTYFINAPGGDGVDSDIRCRHVNNG